MSKPSLEDIVSLCKRRGFIYQGSEIYGGLAGIYDYGPLGAQLKRNINNLWWKKVVEERDNVYGLDAAILMKRDVWVASGHVAGFADPMVEDTVNKKRYRADHLLEDKGVSAEGMDLRSLTAAIKENGIKSPDGNPLGEVKMFNTLLPVRVGSVEDESSLAYLRGETAQGIFVNYKNVMDSFHPSLPFGVAQIGKAFRNEISPRDFIFRLRELEQMEMQYFIDPKTQAEEYENWRQFAWNFLTKELEVPESKLKWHEHGDNERAHYAAAAHDIYFEFPQGFKELWGTHNRTDFDLKTHSEHSGKDLFYFNQATGEKFIPNVIESSVGLDRMLMAVLSNAYSVDEQAGEQRVFLKLPPHLAPVKVAVFPLLKNKPELVQKAREVYESLRKQVDGEVMWDDNGNIGKRYRRQDEIGTPYCITIDFDTLQDDTVTLRSRDTTEQKRVKSDEIYKSVGS
ncbi:MAG TPA: glycine--tRNA ligase [Candidatus Saccharimonadales bacterium]|nr:glycine--tRNA ligase [Candidatus Saccharimonadales bacterium]